MYNFIDMTDRYCLITGAAGSLGRTIAQTLSELNCGLILVDRDKSSLTKFTAEGVDP